MLCTSHFQNRPSPHAPVQTPGHLTLVKNFGQIPRDVASLEGQMPHPLELQRESNRLFKYTYSVINNWLLFALTISQNRKAVVVLRQTFTYEKKTPPTNNICILTRSPKEREA